METTASPTSLFAVIAAGIVAGALLATTVASTSPQSAEKADFWVVFVALFVLLTSFGTLAWYFLQRILAKKLIHIPSFYRCLRQASLVAGIVTFTIFLNSINVFQIWDIFPLIVAGVLIEFFFQAEKQPHASLRHVSQDADSN
jgi:drug/metabolite transporter (DMT)-like permease